MRKIYIIIGIFIIVLGTYVTLKDNTLLPAASTNDVEVVSDVSTLSLTKQLVFDSVKIDSVNLKSGGFVVVREVEKDKLAQIVEVSSVLPKGISIDVRIDLLEIPRDDILLIAVIYEDDGDNSFNPMADLRVDTSAIYIDTGEKVPVSLFNIPVSENKSAAVTIAYSDEGYLPGTVTIEQGQPVSFVNNSEMLMWVASDPHPAHTILSSFDQFSGSKPGTTYQYTFDEIGVWKYHDHMNPGSVGTVVVTESISESFPKVEKNTSGYYEIDADTFESLVDDAKVTTINVHTPFAGEIPGTDVSVPYNQTDALIAALPKDKNAPIALYCRSGGMSSIASKDIVAAGYTNVYDLVGGMIVYEKSGRLLIK